MPEKATKPQHETRSTFVSMFTAFLESHRYLHYGILILWSLGVVGTLELAFVPTIILASAIAVVGMGIEYLHGRHRRQHIAKLETAVAKLRREVDQLQSDIDIICEKNGIVPGAKMDAAAAIAEEKTLTKQALSATKKGLYLLEGTAIGAGAALLSFLMFSVPITPVVLAITVVSSSLFALMYFYNKTHFMMKTEGHIKSLEQEHATLFSAKQQLQQSAQLTEKFAQELTNAQAQIAKLEKGPTPEPDVSSKPFLTDDLVRRPQMDEKPDPSPMASHTKPVKPTETNDDEPEDESPKMSE